MTWDGVRSFVLGIDIGVTGGLAILSDAGALIEVHRMPCLHDGPKNRQTINGPLLAELVYKSHARSAFIERVGPRPGEGSVSAFAFGDCKGVIRGVLAAAAIPTVWLTPPQWKRVIGIPPGKEGAKDAARGEAIRRWPSQAGHFSLKNSDGLAEAALIGLAGLLAFDTPKVVHTLRRGPNDEVILDGRYLTREELGLGPRDDGSETGSAA